MAILMMKTAQSGYLIFCVREKIGYLFESSEFQLSAIFLGNQNSALCSVCRTNLCLMGNYFILQCPNPGHPVEIVSFDYVSSLL